MENSNKKVISGFIWALGERISAQLVTIIVTIVLARLLLPDEFGAISLITVLITFMNIFVSSGFVSALVQKKDATDVDFNTAFVLGATIATVMYILLFITSPYIALFYKNDILCPVFRVMGLRLFLAAFNSIQQAYYRRNMQFKKFFIATLFGSVISGIVGITLAYFEFGIWALAAQYLTNTTIDTIVLFFVGGWRPSLHFSKESAKSMWSFGWKVLVSQLISGLKDNVRTLIVGKAFGTSDLAYYDQGNRYPNVLVSNVNIAVEKVMLPVFSKSQDNKSNLKNMLRRTVKIGMYVLAPVLIGFAVVAEQFVHVVLTDKWLPVVPFIQIFCVSYLTRPIEVACGQSLLAIGRSKDYLRCIVLIDGMSLFFVLLSVFYFKSVILIALFTIFTAFISISVLLIFTNRLLNYSLNEQLIDFVPPIICSIVMGGVVYFVGLITLPSEIIFLLQIVSGIMVYVFESIVFRLEPFYYLLKMIKGKK